MQMGSAGVTDGGSRRSVYMTVTLHLIAEWSAYGCGGAFNSRTSLPRQYVSGKHFTLNPCFPRSRSKSPAAQKPPEEL